MDDGDNSNNSSMVRRKKDMPWEGIDFGIILSNVCINLRTRDRLRRKYKKKRERKRKRK